MASMPDNFEGWPTKAQLSKETGISERTLDRMVSKGELQQGYRQMPGRRPIALINPADAQKLRDSAMKPSAFLMQDENPPTLTHSDKSLALVKRSSTTDALTTAIQQAVQSAQMQATRLFLTLDEASEYSGLPKAYLSRALASGELPGLKANGWRIRRRDLDKL